MKLSGTKIGFIGAGIMGSSLINHLLNANFSVTVYSRTKKKAEPLLAKGANWSRNPIEVAENSDIVFSMVGFPSDVREIYLGQNGILNSMKPGRIVVDMTTSSPSLAREIYVTAKKRHLSALDAPVTGGDIGAREARLSIMVGGDKKTFTKIRPILERFGTNIVYQGPAGSGQHCKLCNQVMIAGTMMGMAEGLIYAKKEGLDLKTVLESISGGAAGSWSLNHLAPRILKKDYEPGFMIEHFIKDLSLAQNEAHQLKFKLPGLITVLNKYKKLSKCGYSRKGTQALILALNS
jgi:3-hydroxyisobutyrate dehydrogenase